jgi:hypothetical protein
MGGPAGVSGVGRILEVVGERPARQAIPRFLLRLETGPGKCFVGVTGISNNFQYRLEI